MGMPSCKLGTVKVMLGFGNIFGNDVARYLSGGYKEHVAIAVDSHA